MDIITVPRGSSQLAGETHFLYNREVVKNFAVIGAAGFVAPRHLQAIRATGNRLFAAADPHDSVGVLDGAFPDARFFTEIERLDRFLDKQRRGAERERVHYVSICSPNYLHDAHIRMALRVGAQAICEKPLVVNPWNLDALEEIEQETGQRVWTILQLRLHPSIVELKQKLANEGSAVEHDVVLTYVTRRGPWYHQSWKGSDEKSGGLAMNIGVHFFDILMWLFGDMRSSEVHLRDRCRVSGELRLACARVRWFLSIDRDDLPPEVRDRGGHAYRSLVLDGNEVEFSGGFTDLHTRVYEATLEGKGFSIADARPSVEAVYAVRQADVVPGDDPHPNAARHPHAG
jgi:UDP-N-acetyl-2-amino-2-deoxyglucuronate dehydrogenase